MSMRKKILLLGISIFVKKNKTNHFFFFDSKQASQSLNVPKHSYLANVIHFVGVMTMSTLRHLPQHILIIICFQAKIF